ncbi:MAG: hypothetical protein EOO66_22300 [Methylobacterium sp.]|nr:MAG: hypothetical protein EOO66_22300 [Methylobacterium sp.]
MTVGPTTISRGAPGTRVSRAETAAIRDVRGRVGFVFQNFNLWPHLTALGNVMEVPVQVQRRPRAASRLMPRST